LVTFAQESIKQIASKTPVVLLNSGVHADEHLDVRIKPTENVFELPELPPETNLAVLAAIMGRALGFVGTYGGLAQLALRLGKPSVSYYHEWGGTAVAHKHLADAIALQNGLPCIVHKVGELPLLQTVAPIFGQSQQSS
jgi:ADP-heptose:LPS heptosyltransferase